MITTTARRVVDVCMRFSYFCSLVYEGDSVDSLCMHIGEHADLIWISNQDENRLLLVSQATPFAERGRVQSCCNHRVVTTAET